MIAVGDTVWVQLATYRHDTFRELVAWQVTKVGRVWATIGPDLNSFRFRIDPEYYPPPLDGGEWASPGRVFMTATEAAEYTRSEAAWAIIRRQGYRPPRGVVEALEKVAAAIEADRP